MISQISSSSRILKPFFKAEEIIVEEMDEEFEDAQDWITDIIENRDRPKLNHCEICHSSEKLEQHHIRGRKHGNETITVCYKCHSILTNKQRLWDRSWLDPNTENKDIFLNRGIIDVCELKYQKTGKKIYGKYAQILTEGFTYD